MAFLSKEELHALGFRTIGSNVLISDKASIYNAGNIEIGDNVRIDDFCILSAGEGGIRMGSFIHMACYSSIIGKGRVIIEDFSGLSSRVSVYSSNDDYSGQHMTNPMVPEEFTNVSTLPVHIGKHVLVGAGSIVLPGVTMHEGSSAGALSLINRDIEPFTIVAGVPAKPIGRRSDALLQMEERLKQQS